MHVWKSIRKNVVKFFTPPSVVREAIQWVVRMDSDEPLSDAEKAALREWISRGVLHRCALMRFSRFWSEAEILSWLKDRSGYSVQHRLEMDQDGSRYR
jgi:ferric-dicitrate binding protein FerR (iron transport regulator)